MASFLSIKLMNMSIITDIPVTGVTMVVEENDAEADSESNSSAWDLECCGSSTIPMGVLLELLVDMLDIGWRERVKKLQSLHLLRYSERSGSCFNVA